MPDARADAGDARPPGCPSEASWVHTVRGRVIDESGAGLPEAKAQLCLRVAPDGLLVCLQPATADASGRFEVELPVEARCLDRATARVLLPGTDRATAYCGITLPAGPVIELDAPFTLYTTARATELPPLGDEAAVRTVRFADGLELDVVPRDLFGAGGGYEELAARRVSTSTPDLCVLEGAPADLAGLIAFSPEADLEGRFAARIPNASQLAPAARVRVFVLGGLSCTVEPGVIVPEGEWAEAGEGVVGPDGRWIEADVPCLGWLGWTPR